jgi:hypothetical protein
MPAGPGNSRLHICPAGDNSGDLSEVLKRDQRIDGGALPRCDVRRAKRYDVDKAGVRRAGTTGTITLSGAYSSPAKRFR